PPSRSGRRSGRTSERAPPLESRPLQRSSPLPPPPAAVPSPTSWGTDPGSTPASASLRRRYLPHSVGTDPGSTPTSWGTDPGATPPAAWVANPWTSPPRSGGVPPKAGRGRERSELAEDPATGPGPPEVVTQGLVPLPQPGSGPDIGLGVEWRGAREPRSGSGRAPGGREELEETRCVRVRVVGVGIAVRLASHDGEGLVDP